MSGTEVEVYATVHLEVVCSCGAELVVKKHPGSINCCEAIEVEPCDRCVRKYRGATMTVSGDVDLENPETVEALEDIRQAAARRLRERTP